MRRVPLVARVALVALFALLGLAGCGPKEAQNAAAPASSAGMAPPVPDVGKLETTQVTATGIGSTAAQAVGEAMKMAVLQVNGAVVEMASLEARSGIDATMGKDAASLRTAAFSEAVRQRSGGTIQDFRITDLSEPLLPQGRFKATIEARVARFAPSADMKKLRLVVAPPRFDRATVPLGDRSMPAAEASALLRQLIQDAFVNTGRFAVLDREWNPDIAQELDLIADGNAPKAEMAKLQQMASADLVWTAKVHLAYDRHARALRSSDRTLVSYSGGWEVSQKLVNVATRQVHASETLRGAAPSTAPTTLSMGVDPAKVLAGMTDDLVARVVASVLARTFPVTVVALDGTNAVLSQGGLAVAAGRRYAVVTMGAALKDPQTGQDLGRMESPCCEIVVDRVTPNLSYGHLENVRGTPDALKPGMLQLREALAAAPGAVAQADAPRRGKGKAAADDGPDPADEPMPGDDAPAR